MLHPSLAAPCIHIYATIVDKRMHVAAFSPALYPVYVSSVCPKMIPRCSQLGAPSATHRLSACIWRVCDTIAGIFVLRGVESLFSTVFAFISIIGPQRKCAQLSERAMLQADGGSATNTCDGTRLATHMGMLAGGKFPVESVMRGSRCGPSAALHRHCKTHGHGCSVENRHGPACMRIIMHACGHAHEC